MKCSVASGICLVFAAPVSFIFGLVCIIFGAINVGKCDQEAALPFILIGIDKSSIYTALTNFVAVHGVFTMILTALLHFIVARKVLKGASNVEDPLKLSAAFLAFIFTVITIVLLGFANLIRTSEEEKVDCDEMFVEVTFAFAIASVAVISLASIVLFGLWTYYRQLSRHTTDVYTNRSFLV